MAFFCLLKFFIFYSNLLISVSEHPLLSLLLGAVPVSPSP